MPDLDLIKQGEQGRGTGADGWPDPNDSAIEMAETVTSGFGGHKGILTFN
jgi:hypothetical protein